jgi:electron transport complex protein RnfE
MAMPTRTISQEFTKGLWQENPIFRQLLGMCPTLAVTNAMINGLAMGLATSFVLIFSSLVVSSIKRLIPRQVRIACYIVIIASFVTIADRFLAAFFPPLSKSLGPYVPLIVVNCIILGRQEAFASKNTIGRSLFDAFGMSIGFIIALLIILPPGAFIALGFLIGLALFIEHKTKGGR